MRTLEVALYQSLPTEATCTCHAGASCLSSLRPILQLHSPFAQPARPHQTLTLRHDAPQQSYSTSQLPPALETDRINTAHLWRSSIQQYLTKFSSTQDLHDHVRTHEHVVCWRQNHNYNASANGTIQCTYMYNTSVNNLSTTRHEPLANNSSSTRAAGVHDRTPSYTHQTWAEQTTWSWHYAHLQVPSASVRGTPARNKLEGCLATGSYSLARSAAVHDRVQLQLEQLHCCCISSAGAVMFQSLHIATQGLKTGTATARLQDKHQNAQERSQCDFGAIQVGVSRARGQAGGVTRAACGAHLPA